MASEGDVPLSHRGRSSGNTEVVARQTDISQVPVDMPLPDGKSAAVALTFDLDGDAGHDTWRDLDWRLTSLTEAQYGIQRGLSRIVDLLQRYRLGATFYVCGQVADEWPGAVEMIADSGFEIGNHGYSHAFTDRVTGDDQWTELKQTQDALAKVAGGAPKGFRSPGWELTAEAIRMLPRLGIAYDSSLMGDDRVQTLSFGDEKLLEFPVHWSLDDAAYFRFARDSSMTLSDPESFFRVLGSELQSTLDEKRVTTWTFHPEMIGRAHRLAALERVIMDALDLGNVWFASHGELARHLAASR